MAFKNEYRDFNEEMPEWQYLTDIGVRDMFGHPIRKCTLQLTVDRENNYFFIGRGQIWEDGIIKYCALCLDGIVLNLKARDKSEGSCRNKDCRQFWEVFKIHYPENWDSSLFTKDKLAEIIRDALITDTKWVGEEGFKDIIVDIPALDRF